jgi:hypothetical protein
MAWCIPFEVLPQWHLGTLVLGKTLRGGGGVAVVAFVAVAVAAVVVAFGSKTKCFPPTNSNISEGFSLCAILPQDPPQYEMLLSSA